MATVPQPLQLRPQDAPGLGRSALQALNTYLRQVQQGINGKLTFSENHVATIVTQQVQILNPVVAPTLLNSWTDYDARRPHSVQKLQNGWCVMRGSIKGGTLNAKIMDLPSSAYWPAVLENCITYDSGTTDVGRVIVDLDGQVYVFGASNGEFALTCHWMAADPTPVPNIQNGPLAFAHGLSGRCTDLLVTAVTNLAGAAVNVAGCFPSWTDDGKGNVVVTNLAGLVPTGTYLVRFLCLGEPQ